MLLRSATGMLAGIDPERLRIETDPNVTPGLALVDAPDIDSVEHANRELADRLVEAADLCLFVTTATRYADHVPWLVLDRVRERGLPLVVVVEPPAAEPDDRREVLDDVRRLFSEAGFAAAEAGGAALEIVGVTEGEIDPAGEALGRRAIAPVMARIDASPIRPRRTDRAGRTRARRIPGRARPARRPGRRRRGPRGDRRGRSAPDRRDPPRPRAGRGPRGDARGSFLREEALRHWQDYVGADDVTRIFSQGHRGGPRGDREYLPAVPRAGRRDSRGHDRRPAAAARLHASEAARRTASAWSEDRAVADAVAAIRRCGARPRASTSVSARDSTPGSSRSGPTSRRPARGSAGSREAPRSGSTPSVSG